VTQIVASAGVMEHISPNFLLAFDSIARLYTVRANYMSKRTITDTIERAAGLTLADGRQLDLSRPLVMGTLNVTPDSFSDGGQYTSRVFAVGRALEMEGHGAQIIDVGGESTRPDARPVSAEEEMRRVLPIVEGIRKASDIPISIDTYKAATARAALAAGADIVNDITGLRGDPDGFRS